MNAKTNFKDFTLDIWAQIESQIDTALKKPGPHYAAFDADGTLWDNDAGNAFFDYEIEKKFFQLPENPWEYVYNLKKEDPRKCFLWLAQVHKGLPISQVRKWAQESHIKNNGIHYFPAVKKLISILKSKNVEIFVVTASVTWAVEPCVVDLGIPPENVLGVQTKIQDGVVTDIQDGAVTYKEGKAIRLLEKTKGKHPILCAGNTLGDLYMLELASHVKLAFRCVNDNIAFKDKDISNQEIELYEEAKKRGWLTHNFA